MVCGIKYEWIDELLHNRTKVDVNRLIGRDVREVVKSMTVDHQEQQQQQQQEAAQQARDEKLKEKFAKYVVHWF